MSEKIKTPSWGKIIRTKNIMRGLKEIETDTGVIGYVITVNFANKNLSKEALNFMENYCDGKHYFFKKTDSDLWQILAYEISNIHIESFNELNYSKEAFKMSLEYALSENCSEYAKEKGFFIASLQQKATTNKNNRTKDEENTTPSYENEENILNEKLNIEKLLKELYADGYNNEQVEKTIKYDSNSPNLFFEKGNDCNRKKSYFDAIRFYLESLRMSLNSVGLYNLGTIYLKENKYIFAAQCLKKAIELDENDSRFFHNLGVALFKIDGDKYIGKSLIYFKKALSLNPNDEECKKALSIVESSIINSMNDEM